MAAKKKAEGATGTVQARRAAEAEREAEARRVRAEVGASNPSPPTHAPWTEPSLSEWNACSPSPGT
jgi:hypothetical protein